MRVPFVHGGAETHADNLVTQLRMRGCEAELVSIPFKWYPPQAILDSMAMARLLDLTETNGARIDRLIGLKFPAYFAPHPDKVLWILHQHRTAYELWDHPEFGDLINFPDGKAVRDAIRHADNLFLPEARAIHTNSRNVSDRLKRFNKIDAAPLYHPPNGAELLYRDEADAYVYFPSRITRLKRQDLVIQALALCREPVHVVFSGTPECAIYMAELQDAVARHGLHDRVRWLGFLPEQEKLRLYARCLAVIYPPTDEDYGYVTLEAMLAGKPVVTTSDAGGPLEFLIDRETGLVAEPTASSLALAMDRMWRDPRRAAQMGMAGRERYDQLGISWDHVVEVLTS